MLSFNLYSIYGQLILLIVRLQVLLQPTGRLRVYATVIDLAGHGLDDKPDEVDRDQLA